MSIDKIVKHLTTFELVSDREKQIYSIIQHNAQRIYKNAYESLYSALHSGYNSTLSYLNEKYSAMPRNVKLGSAAAMIFGAGLGAGYLITKPKEISPEDNIIVTYTTGDSFGTQEVKQTLRDFKSSNKFWNAGVNEHNRLVSGKHLLGTDVRYSPKN